MKKQLTMSLISDELREASTPKKVLLERMDRIIPWEEWVKIVSPHYYKGERGNKPFPLELLLRQLYITTICLSKAPAAALSSVADATASPPSSALHLTLYPAHLIGNI